MTERVSLQKLSMQNKLDPYEGKFRVVLLDGRERWLATRGRNVDDPRGRGSLRMGVVLDITERKRAEESLRESEARFHIMASSRQARRLAGTCMASTDWVEIRWPRRWPPA